MITELMVAQPTMDVDLENSQPQKGAAGACTARKQCFEKSRSKNGHPKSAAGLAMVRKQYFAQYMPKTGPPKARQPLRWLENSTLKNQSSNMGTPKSAAGIAMARKRYFEKSRPKNGLPESAAGTAMARKTLSGSLRRAGYFPNHDSPGYHDLFCLLYTSPSPRD